MLNLIYLAVLFNWCIGYTKSDRVSKAGHRRSILSRGGFGGVDTLLPLDEEEDVNIDTVYVCDAIVSKLNGKYIRDENDINGRPHYFSVAEGNTNSSKIHLYWSGSQWVLHYDTDPSLNFEHLLAYAKVRVANPKKTSTFWHVRKGSAYSLSPSLHIKDINEMEKRNTTRVASVNMPEILGVPVRLLPLYFAFMCDAIAVGLAMPLLPFFVMELGANAFQLSIIVSSNYIAQMIGCLIVGQISDKYGRKPVLSMAMLASFISYLSVSLSTTLPQVTIARMIVGSFGGLVPIVQSSVADVTSSEDRPKYFARVMATYGLGFVIGPALSALLPRFSTREKLMLSSLFPLIGLLTQLAFFKETKQGVASTVLKSSKSTGKTSSVPVVSRAPPISSKVLLLLLNGFMLMYAFSVETIYAMFIKDNFGYGEKELSTLFACNGVLIGVFQVFFIKPVVTQIGKHWTLIAGNAILAVGMIGLSLIRLQWLHFSLFVMHIVGYSIADTALASLISKYSSPKSQGRDLAYNQAAQACARVVSPLAAGLLYERSKSIKGVPIGALPYLVGAVFPLMGTVVPFVLYSQSVKKKKKIIADDLAFEAA